MGKVIDVSIDPNAGGGGGGGSLPAAWGNWADTQYTGISKLTLPSGVRTKLPNNAGSIIDEFMPDGVTFYDGDKITPAGRGEAYLLRINFKSDSGTVNNFAEAELDIGDGSPIVILERTMDYPRGAAIEHGFSTTNFIYALDTFIDNGGEIFLTPDNDVDIWDISYTIGRVSGSNIDIPEAPIDGDIHGRKDAGWASTTKVIHPTGEKSFTQSETDGEEIIEEWRDELGNPNASMDGDGRMVVKKISTGGTDNSAANGQIIAQHGTPSKNISVRPSEIARLFTRAVLAEGNMRNQQIFTEFDAEANGGAISTAVQSQVNTIRIAGTGGFTNSNDAIRTLVGAIEIASGANFTFSDSITCFNAVFSMLANVDAPTFNHIIGFHGAPNELRDAIVTNLTTLFIDDDFGGASSVANRRGVWIKDLTQATISRAFQSDMNLGAGKHGLYFPGTADNYLEGDLGLGIADPTVQAHIVGDMILDNGTQAAGRLAQCDANGFVTWVDPPSGGGSAVYFPGELAGQASATIGKLAKASDAGSTANPSGKPITNAGSPGFNNGATMGHEVPEAGLSAVKLGIKFAGAAVGTGTVGSPVVRMRLFRQDYSSRVQLGADIDIPINTSGVGVFNNTSANAQQYASAVISIAVNEGDLIGWEFVNVSGSNDNINALSRISSTLKLA